MAERKGSAASVGVPDPANGTVGHASFTAPDLAGMRHMMQSSLPAIWRCSCAHNGLRLATGSLSGGIVMLVFLLLTRRRFEMSVGSEGNPTVNRNGVVLVPALNGFALRN